MRFEPHEYQRTAIDKILTTPRCGLFLDMGLGKTVITLTAVERLMYDSFEVGRVLVIAPLRVAEDTWSRECEKWEHLRHLTISKILGTPAQRRAALAAEADIYIINRENVVWLCEELSKNKPPRFAKSVGACDEDFTKPSQRRRGRHELRSCRGCAPILNNWCFDMVVIDELSSFKSPKAQRFRALRKVIGGSRRVVGLTGTPAPNGLIDLWSEMYLIDGGERLGRTVTGYRERYFVPDKRNQTTIFTYKPKPEAEAAIRAKLADICVSMKAEDWLTLPGRIDCVTAVKLTPAQRKAYDKFERDMYIEFTEGDVSAVSAAALTNKLLQYSNGAMYTESGDYIETGEGKLDALGEIIEAANGAPILCFYSYKHDLERIQRRFPQAVKLESAEHIAAWNEGKIPLLLAHPAGAGHGLNLQAGGNIIVWFGLTWSLELYQQANARLHRQGQQRAVIVHHLLTENTADERVYRSLRDKSAVQDELLEALKEKYGGDRK